MTHKIRDCFVLTRITNSQVCMWSFLSLFCRVSVILSWIFEYLFKTLKVMMQVILVKLSLFIAPMYYLCLIVTKRQQTGDLGKFVVSLSLLSILESSSQIIDYIHTNAYSYDCVRQVSQRSQSLCHVSFYHFTLSCDYDRKYYIFPESRWYYVYSWIW